MEKNRFVQLVADMLYRTDRESLNLETLYKSLEEWNYLFEVSLAMMLEEEYQVEVTPEDFDCTRTLGGLAGIVGEVDLMEQVLLHMSAAQNHRGKETPNSWVSSFIDARVGLMHNRMKTIDMAVAPKQPFEDNDTGLVVMLDGEILTVGEMVVSTGSRDTFLSLYTIAGRRNCCFAEIGLA